MIDLYELIRMSPKGRRIFWIIVSLSVVSIFFFVFYGERDYKKDISINKANSYLEGVRIVSKKDGADVWMITARRADFTKDETIAKMDSVTIDIKKEGVVLNADNGIYNMNTRDLHLENNIKVLIKDSVISAKDLTWNPSGGILSSDDKIQMEGKKFKIEGEGLNATEDNKIKLMRNVKAIFF